MWAILILAGALVAGLLMTAGILVGAGKWMKYGNSSFSRAMLTAVVLLVCGLGIRAAELLVPSESRVAYELATVVMQLVLVWWLVKVMHRTTTGRAAAGMGFLFLGSVLALTVILLVVRPRVAEAYAMSAGGMAPTLQGDCVLVKCPHCGADVYVDLELAQRGAGVAGLQCTACGQFFTLPSTVGPAIPADRIISVKFLSPRRWDLVTFHEDGNLWVKRVVGLPGETVMIDAAGNVSINGGPVSADPLGPTTFPWWKQLDSLPQRFMSPGQAVRLGADDYFLVGDNSRESVDSRLRGPVKRKDVEGVVSAVYWPLGRVRLFR